MAFQKQIIMCVLGIALVILTAAYALSNPQEGQALQEDNVNMIVVTEKDNGNRLELNKGDVFIVKLECSPGTGYSWQIAKNDDKLMEQQGEPVYEKPTRELLVGGVENVIFRFKALANGANTLELHYKRVWEKDKPPQKIFMVIVNVL